MRISPNKLLFISLLLVTTGQEAHASAYYVVPRVGAMDIQLNNASMLATGGLYAGYSLARDFAFEAEFFTGMAGGSYSDAAGRGSYDISVLGGYAVYRLALVSQMFAKARLGGVYERVRNNAPLGQTLNSTHAGLSGGIGLGLALTEDLTLELEALGIEQDILFYGFGGHYRF